MKKSVAFVFVLVLFLQVALVSSERYIVEVDEDTSRLEELDVVDEIDSLKHSGSVAGARISPSKKKFVIESDSEEVKELYVERIEPDYRVKALGEVTPWNYEVVGLNFSEMNGGFGNGVKIAVLDTGVDFNVVNAIDGYDFVNEDGDASDDNGHGTFVTQVLRNYENELPLRNSEIYSVKVLGEDGSGWVSDIMEGIAWSIDNDMDIVIMSFGGEGVSFFLQEIISQGNDEGVLFIAAAGNENDFVLAPARFEEVIGVGSVGRNLEKSSFSNYGEELDFVAPGEEIVVFNDGEYWLVQGTSFSVPHVAVVASGYWGEDGDLTNTEIKEKLKESALDLGNEGRDDLFGEGLVRFDGGSENNSSAENINFDILTTCTDYGHNFGSCLQDGIQKREGNHILECDDQIFIGEFLCWEIFRTMGDGDFCQELTDINLACLRNEYDCDSSNQCVSGLVCDGNTGRFDLEDEGCCFVYENWNTNSNQCKDAVKGKIYQVTQNGQTFNESPYWNLKLRVFFMNEDPIEDDIWYFDIQSDSLGNFAFNPERYNQDWNKDILDVEFKVKSIFAFEGTEAIGKWTNQFSADPKYKNAIESVNQVVRIHKDKTTWRPNEIPFANEGEANFNTQSLEINSLSNEEEYRHITWKGKLLVNQSGEYNFFFNVTEDVVLRINNETLIDTKKEIGESKTANIKLEFGEQELFIEFIDKMSNYPQILWGYESEELVNLGKNNLVRETADLDYVNLKNPQFKVAAPHNLINNQPDYMISFLEEPNVIRNQKPLVLVHGKHGESGYWDEDEAQKWFNDNGYDAWEFYYPGDDHINVSGALLGDVLDYLKRKHYGQNQKFDIVSHSMGGLVSRSYIQNISSYNYKNDVNHLVMIGSPNYGNGAATGISHGWKKLGLSYGLLEDIRLFSPGIHNSPIYTEMSLSSKIIDDLSLANISPNSLVINGNEDINFIDNIFCSALTLAHKEADPDEYDCLVAVSSSSLLDRNIPLSVIPAKSHFTEVSEIQDYAQLIKSFLDDKSDSVLASQSFAYYNPQTNFKKNFNYQEGSVQIKLLEDGQTWNQFDNADLEIERISTGERFEMTRNQQSRNYFHFNREGGEPDSYYTMPYGEYKLIVPNYADKPELHFIVKPMETNFLVIDLTEPICPPSWQCSPWSPGICPQNGQQTRTCSDLNACGTNDGKPNEIQSCQPTIGPQLSVISPTPKNYSERRIFFNVNVNDEVDEITYIDWNDRRPRELMLCRNCENYDRTKSFRDGEHNVTFMAKENGEVVSEENVEFFVDSKSPRISKSEPRRGYANGNFSVEFREDNVEKVTLYYGIESNIRERNLTEECFEDRTTYKCSVHVDVSDFDGSEIQYQFSVEDIVGNLASSKIINLDVDVTEPILNNGDSFVTKDSRYLYFNLNINEINFDEATYKYVDNRGVERERRFCSRLRDGICESRQRYNENYDYISILIYDEAGNFVEVPVNV